MTQIKLNHSSFSFLSQGAIIQEFRVAGHNLVLSFSSSEPYLEAPYFGETIGRVANRISGGLIQNLNGRTYQLDTNSACVNHLHGGTTGWGRREFSGPHRVTRNSRDAIKFTYLSPDGEEDYPGTVELRVWYTPSEEDDNVTVLEIEYEAELVGRECEETVVNVTNHSYFNLGGMPTVEGTQITMATNKVLVTDESQIPTGEVTTFAGVETDRVFTLGSQAPSIDNCFIMDTEPHNLTLDTRHRELRRLVSAYHPFNGITLEVYSTEPSFQFYTGDYVDVPSSAHGPARPARAGFCVEPCRFINAVNEREWRQQVVLRQGQAWGSRIIYKAWKT